MPVKHLKQMKKVVQASLMGLCAGALLMSFASPSFSEGTDAKFSDICADPFYPEACAQEAKIINTERSQGVVKRTGNTLCLQPQGTLDAQPVCFTNVRNPQADDAEETYFYFGQLPHWPDIAMVYAQYWEGAITRYISTINGKTLLEMLSYTEMSLSPDGKYVAFAMVDDADFYDLHGAWLYEINDQREWVLRWSSENPNEGYTNLKWDNNQQFRLTRSTHEINVSSMDGQQFVPEVLGEMIVTHKGSDWVAISVKKTEEKN